MTACRSPEHHVEDGIDRLSERGVEQVGEVPATLLIDPLGMAEGTETLDAVVSAHAAGPDAAEGQVILGDVHDRPVDSDVAGDRSAQHLASVFVIGAEVVERERPGPGVHIGDRFFNLAVGKIGRIGPKISS